MMRGPTIAVGLIENSGPIDIRLTGDFIDAVGNRFFPGDYHVSVKDQSLICSGSVHGEYPHLALTGLTPSSCFRLQVTIGINFHWQQKQEQTFCGALRLIPKPGKGLLVINDVPLESYILSVSSSEMSAGSPEEFLKAHSIVSRSWLLAQLESKGAVPAPQAGKDGNGAEILRWYDRQAHTDFDVCADDHCQRYQGMDVITTGRVADAVRETAGQVLVFDSRPCDARFSKCCGGITEDFRLAWAETAHPYLVPVFDGPAGGLPGEPLSDEPAAREFMTRAPDVYCNCKDEEILGRVLNNYDRTTRDFFRWRVRLTPDEIAGYLDKKLNLDLGRIIALEPVERGLSGRLKRLRLRGEKGGVVIGKELEIRRALSATHLYSSAFVVDSEGPKERPDAFVLSGAGWGHGVGLCQIGAAVMASRGAGYREILAHYYPGSSLEQWYSTQI